MAVHPASRLMNLPSPLSPEPLPNHHHTPSSLTIALPVSQGASGRGIAV
eukprot:CAMPEP_0174747106 /NCGR_PEP_ID=MMETSP1094-20130205/90530_1 /TAXON_ID=156173 /ORGANISM="Chrysochromulina brevifilum, Strain UTEX LB 985" /LENGTH=48 /DNA_ID= /DNA_START= /DNA_END= /DNA_ORIENTATION=